MIIVIVSTCSPIGRAIKTTTANPYRSTATLTYIAAGANIAAGGIIYIAAATIGSNTRINNTYTVI
jgi:hypothetical protein